jgi:hypothetical protein
MFMLGQAALHIWAVTRKTFGLRNLGFDMFRIRTPRDVSQKRSTKKPQRSDTERCWSMTQSPFPTRLMQRSVRTPVAEPICTLKHNALMRLHIVLGFMVHLFFVSMAPELYCWHLQTLIEHGCSLFILLLS